MTRRPDNEIAGGTRIQDVQYECMIYDRKKTKNILGRPGQATAWMQRARPSQTGKQDRFGATQDEGRTGDEMTTGAASLIAPAAFCRTKGWRGAAGRVTDRSAPSRPLLPSRELPSLCAVCLSSLT